MVSAGRGYLRLEQRKCVGGSSAVSMMLDKFEDVVGQCELRLQVPPTVDDLRIAIDEVCHAVLKSTEAPITVGFSAEPGLVRIQGAARREGGLRPLHLPRISQLIVDAVADEVEIVDGSAGIRFTLVMRGPR